MKFQESSDAVGTISKTQSSHVGKSARLWKVVTVDGVEESREVFNKTTYKASPTIYAVGVSSENPEAVSAMKARLPPRMRVRSVRQQHSGRMQCSSRSRQQIQRRIRMQVRHSRQMERIRLDRPIILPSRHNRQITNLQIGNDSTIKDQVERK